MKTIAKILIVPLLILISIPLEAQVLLGNELNDYVQRSRIGLIDEFFDRFNGKSSNPELSEKIDNSKENYLITLFDLYSFKSEDDPLFKEAIEMTKIITKDSIQINFCDSTWFALAKCRGTLYDKEVDFNLYLSVQERGQGMYKWVISQADGEIFEIEPRNKSDKIMLYPDDHETNFMSLTRMTKEQPFNIKNFLRKDVAFSKMSIFAYLVYSGKLKINYISELELVFTQVPGFIFHVKYFEREKANSGWLISDFYKVKDFEKKKFVQMIYQRFEQYDEAFVELSPSCNSENAVEDISANTTMEDTYLRRLNERLLQIKDHISFIQKSRLTKHAKVHNIDLSRLFAENSKITVIDSVRKEVLEYNVSEFCNHIRNTKHIIQIDSICVPTWDSSIPNLSNKIIKFVTNGCFIQYDTINDIHRLYHNYNQVVPINKEITEDGEEWVPIFGDMTLTIKPRKQ